MKLKERIKTYNFWVSLSSAIFLLLKVLGGQFGFSVDESIFSDLITSLCGILVILGIIVPPVNKTQLLKDSITKTENLLNDKVDDKNTQENINNYSEIDYLNEDKNNSDVIVSENVAELNLNCENNINENDANDMQSESDMVERVDDEMSNSEFQDENQNDIDKLTLDFHQILKQNELIFQNNLNIYIKLLENELESLKKQNI